MIKENHPDNNVGNIEYIRKQDAVDAIHCDITITGRENAETVCKTIASFTDRIKALEPADVVPVCRCKDCKFYTSMRPDIKTGICDLNVHHMGDDGFCSCGERREK